MYSQDRLLTILVLVALLLSACQPTVMPAQTRTAEISQLDPAITRAVELQIEQEMADAFVPGLSVGIVMGGESVFAQGFGMANVETGAPVTSQTVFQVAEVTMAPTAMAILQLVEAGKIDLDAPLTEYLPYFKMADPAAAQMTVRHLLTHRSGLPDSGDTAANWTEITPEMDDGAVERFVRGLAERPLLFTPGERFEWSDIGYDVLGAVIAEVTGQSYEAYMQEHILTPLGMSSSTYLLGEVDRTRLAFPHIGDEDGGVLVSDVIPYSRQFASANNLYTTAEDMAKFAALFLNGGEYAGTRLLSQESVDWMGTHISDTPFADFAFGKVWSAKLFASYGAGWLMGDLAGHTIYSSYGGEYGYQATMMLAPAQDIAVIVMGNGSGAGSIYSADIATDVTGMLINFLSAAEAPATNAVEIFAQGAMLPGAMDITVGTDGMLYVASELGRMVAVVDPDTGEIVQRIGIGSGIDSPTALTTGPDGSIYWSCFYTVQVCRRSPVGNNTCQKLPEDTWGLAFSGDGHLFSAAGAHSQTIYELDPLLQEPPREVVHLDSLLAHFAFGPDGYLYAPLLLEGAIMRIDVNAAPVTVKRVAEGLTFPWALAFDSTGALYATTSVDAEHNALVAVDLESGAIEVIGELPTFYTNLAIDQDDRIFISHFGEGAIYEFVPGSGMVELTPPGMSSPGGLAVITRPDGGESLFVAAWTSLYEFDTVSGEVLNVWRSSWFPGAIPAPRTVASDGEKLLVTAWGDQWGGSAVLGWNSESSSALASVEGVGLPANAIRFQGDMIIVDMAGEDGWQVLRVSGTDMAQRHPLGSDVLQQPLGLAASEDALWVTDYATGNVVQLVAGGEELAEPIALVEGLVQPEGIALGPDGRLIVAETGTGRLLAINPSNATIEVLAEGLGFTQANVTSVGPVSLSPYWVFNGVAVSPSGTIYIACDASNIVYRIVSGSTKSAVLR